MRYLFGSLAAILLALISVPVWAGELDSLLQQAKDLGAPMAAVQRAIAISRQSSFTKKDALAVFDISQPSANKRFYFFDFKSGRVTAHYAAHGRDNGPNAKATKFKGFQTHLDMVPLGPLKTVPNDHALYRSFFKYEDGPPATSHELNGWGDNLVHEHLMGIMRGDRIDVLYSNKDYSSEWSMHPESKRFMEVDPSRFAVNIVVYALTR